MPHPPNLRIAVTNIDIPFDPLRTLEKQLLQSAMAMVRLHDGWSRRNTCGQRVGGATGRHLQFKLDHEHPPHSMVSLSLYDPFHAEKPPLRSVLTF
jgi:hypothetical protein